MNAKNEYNFNGLFDPIDDGSLNLLANGRRRRTNVFVFDRK